MVTFRYKAQGQDGKPIEGIVKAQNEYSAVQKIRETTPVILEITPIKEGGNILSLELGSGKPKASDLAVMCSQLSIMMRSGIQIGTCIEMVANQTEDKRLRKVLTSVAEDVADGNSVAGSFERSGEGFFPPTFIETVRAGEQAGTLDNSFGKLESYFSKSYKNAQKIKSAMSYPLFVVAVAVVVVLVIMVKVVPVLTATFAEFGGELPVITQILIGISNFFSHWWYILLGIIVVLVVGLRIYFNTAQGRLVKGKILLKMPVLGKVNILSGASQFAETMSILLSAGVTVNNATEITSRVLTNEILSRDVAGMTARLEEGKSLGECMNRCEFFPQPLRQMTAIGEESGALEQTLEVIGQYYTNEADTASQKAISKLEPTMMVFLAAFAGFIVLSIYLPMFTMYDLF